MSLIEGKFHGRPVKGSFKLGASKGKKVIVGEMLVTDGEHKGKTFEYQGSLDDKGIKYTKRDIVAAGWKGKIIETLSTDVDALADSGAIVPFEVKIASWQPPGAALREWSTIRSIGGFVRQIDPLSKDDVGNVNKWFADVQDEPKDDSALPF